MEKKEKLIIVKTAHTFVWALFAGSIIATPVYAFLSKFAVSFTLICVVLFEVLILALNKFKCPLTGIAARYTSDRKNNFDIYLPLWLAKYNKEIFGTLYITGIIYTIIMWWVG
ncbi:MAG: hypothetical protein JW927_05750 [Deltaproteobacteria bacterium]|nr:hypothetical protein [Deltaproteobacteria bacterium]